MKEFSLIWARWMLLGCNLLFVHLWVASQSLGSCSLQHRGVIQASEGLWQYARFQTHCILVEAFAFLGCYTVEVGSWLLMFWDKSMFTALISAASFSAGSKWTKKFRYQVYHVISSVIIVSSPDVFLFPCSYCNLRSVTAWTASHNRFDVTGIRGIVII
jgi:hypothetical protein